jgi:uncharacterized protein (TIGR03032 family)
MIEMLPADPVSSLRSVHTSNLPQILTQLGISFVVSTYQAGKLIVVRADNGTLNTHFYNYKKPMGLAADRTRLAIGTDVAIWELRNMPDVARKLEPVGKYDACFLPRQIHVTGDIDIHEMTWSHENNQTSEASKTSEVSPSRLWFINTRFSCLCTFDLDHSFIPRWRPPFVTAYSPEDRCHLNGLSLVEGLPKYVTALGETDQNESWREHKANGGLLMDVETNQILLRGLSMPHSPRWYGGRLWLLESGQGSLAVLDPATGKLATIAQLPGFTRGLDFYGPLAFIGLSKVRDSALFSGIPLVERLEERICGVWVVNIQTGETVAFLRFEEAVQEIFAVQILPGIRFPEILEWDAERIATSYVLPDEALRDVPQKE